MQLHLIFLITLEPTLLRAFIHSLSSLPPFFPRPLSRSFIPLSRLAPLSSYSPRWLPQTNGLVGEHHRSVSDSQLEVKGLEETSLLPRPDHTHLLAPVWMSTVVFRGR